MVVAWIVFVISINVMYLFFKCFMRTISVIINDPSGDADVFDVIHKYRFLIFSTADILNGLSVLYCFHSMASLARKQRFISMTQQETPQSTSETNNENT